MKTEDFIRGLESDDFFVRSTCLSIVSKLPEPPHEAADAAYRSFLKHGTEKAFESPEQMGRLPLNETLYLEILNLVDENSDQHILHWLAKAPGSIVEKHRDKLKSLPVEAFETKFGNILENILQQTESKVEIWQQTAGEHVAQLDELFLRCQQTEEFPQDEVDELELRAEAIAGDTDAFSDDQIIAWLRDPAISQTNHIAGWKAGFAIIIATKRKLEVATPYVLKMFEHDWDWYDEEISNFVKSNSSEDSWRTILTEFPNFNNDSAPLFLSGALGECPPYPGLEDLIINTQALVKDFMAEMFLACYLAKLGTPGGKAAAYGIYQKYEGDPDMEEIPEFLHAVYYLQGDNPGNTEKFRKIVEAKFEKEKNSGQQLAKLFKKLEARTESMEHRTPAPSSGPFKLTNIEPEPEVGRNRPCPCGSGKKHKMCCMKKAVG